MLRSIVALVVCSFPWVAAAEAPGANQKLAVLPLTANRVAEDAKKILDDLLVAEVARVTAYQVIGSSDINAMLGLEKMKQAVGCDDVSCAAEIGGALGVDHLLSGSASRLGSQLIIQLNLIDIRQRLVVKRGKAAVQNDEDAYPHAVTMAVDDLFKLGQAPKVAANSAIEQANGGAGAGPANFRAETEDRGTFNVAIESLGSGQVTTCTTPVTPDKPCLLRDLPPGRAKLRISGDIENITELDIPPSGQQVIATLDEAPSGLGVACAASAIALPAGLVLVLTNLKKDDPATSELEPSGIKPLGIAGAVLGGLGYVGALSTCIVWGTWMEVTLRDVAAGEIGGGGGRKRAAQDSGPRIDVGVAPVPGGGAMVGASMSLP